MKRFARIYALILIAILSHVPAWCQEKDYFGEYRPAVQQATVYLQMIQAQDTDALRKTFTASTFQEENDFINYVSGENIKWASALILQYGIPGDEQTAISVWRAGDKKSETASVNVSFYFKAPTKPMSLLSDRICINMSLRDGVYVLDGVLLFRASEYDAMEKIIQDIPE